MMSNKELYHEVYEELCDNFYEAYGRYPGTREGERLGDEAFNGLGEHYADMVDRARDIAKDNIDD